MQKGVKQLLSFNTWLWSKSKILHILREYAKNFSLLKYFFIIDWEANNFLKCSLIDLDGDAMANKRGILYICESSSAEQKVPIICY